MPLCLFVAISLLAESPIPRPLFCRFLSCRVCVFSHMPVASELTSVGLCLSQEVAYAN